VAGVYARLQPATADFQKEVGGDVREVLEAALARHSTLCEGDWLTAEHAGRAFELHVQKLRPARAVSVIGAPLEHVGRDYTEEDCVVLFFGAHMHCNVSFWQQQ